MKRCTGFSCFLVVLSGESRPSKAKTTSSTPNGRRGGAWSSAGRVGLRGRPRPAPSPPWRANPLVPRRGHADAGPVLANIATQPPPTSPPPVSTAPTDLPTTSPPTTIDHKTLCAQLESQKQAIEAEIKQVEQTYSSDPVTRDRLKAQLEAQQHAIDQQRKSGSPGIPPKRGGIPYEEW